MKYDKKNNSCAKDCISVSYTHLDVYKRQNKPQDYRRKLELLLNVYKEIEMCIRDSSNTY